MSKFVVFKILTYPNQDEFNKVQSKDIEKRYDEKTPFYTWLSLDQNYSYVHKVFVTGIIGDEVKSEKILSFEEFLKYAEKYDDKVIWVGWNCLGYDQPHLLFNMQKKDYIHEIRNLFNMARYRTRPVFDMMQILYNWNYPRSLVLTADSMGLEVKDILLDTVMLESENTKIEKREEYLLETGRLMVKLFLKIKKYYL